MRQQRQRGKHRRRRVSTPVKAVLVALVAALAAGAGYFIWDSFLREPEEYELYQFDTAAMAGRIQNLSEEEIQAELDRVIEEGMFNISIASAIVFETPEAEGQARIENIEANNYYMQVDILLDDTGETVYSSRLIRPGYSIEYITLNRALEPGEYAATAVFSAITQEEMQIYGTAAAQIRLFVLGGEETPAPSASASPAPVEYTQIRRKEVVRPLGHPDAFTTGYGKLRPTRRAPARPPDNPV